MVAPLQVSERKIHAFVSSQQDWVKSATKKIGEKRQNINKLAPDNYKDGARIPYLGKELTLKVASCRSHRPSVDLTEKQCKVHLPDSIAQDDQHETIRQIIIHGMQKQAALAVENFVNKHVKRLQLYPRSLKIKTQKSRWGSCGIHNDININWLLILAPTEVLEYVVVHELCHIKERNHSARFWALVAQHMPDYQQHRNWLKQHGAGLMQGL